MVCVEKTLAVEMRYFSFMPLRSCDARCLVMLVDGPYCLPVRT